MAFRVPLSAYYLQRIPDIFLWGATFSGLVLWPHAFPWAINKIHSVPPINDQMFISMKPIYK